jgi:hypothetical protein
MIRSPVFSGIDSRPKVTAGNAASRQEKFIDEMAMHNRPQLFFGDNPFEDGVDDRAQDLTSTRYGKIIFTRFMQR